MRKTNPVPDDLTIEEKRKVVEWVTTEARIDRRYKKFCTRDAMRSLVGETLDYWRSVGNPKNYHDWAAVVRNRIRWLVENGTSKERYLAEEMPQERREETAQQDLIPIAPIIDMLTRRAR